MGPTWSKYTMFESREMCDVIPSDWLLQQLHGGDCSIFTIELVEGRGKKAWTRGESGFRLIIF